MALEQNEIKKVINVDLGNTTTSLKDYKKHIDELRGSLLQLDESSEEYQKIAKEVKDEQDKLNEVMKVGKGYTDAAEGSYNQLVQTMSDLKKEWRATADEAERAELGQQILDINNQLKELDASTGNFQRNVGDYANAFEKAFDKCLDGIKSLDGPIGELGGTLKNMMPVIKSINTTALKGLDGIKKGIAATGIGLLVVAVASLMQHWQDLTAIVGISEEQIQEFKEKAIETLKNIVAGAVGVGNAIGNFLLAPIKATIEAFKGLGNIIKDVFTGDFSKVKEDATAAFEAIKGIGQKAIDFRGNYEQGKEAADKMIATISDRVKDLKARKAAKEAAKEIGHSIAEGAAEGVEEELETIDSATQAILDRLHRRNTDELELLREKYEEDKALLEQYGYDTAELTQEYEDNRQKIIQKKEDEIYKDVKDHYDNILSIYDAEAKQLEFEAGIEIEDAQRLADAKYQIEQDLLDKKIAALEQYREEVMLTNQDISGIEAELDGLRRQYANNKMQYDKQAADYAKKMAEQEKKDKQIALTSSLSVASSVFGALADLQEENSEEYKAFAIMETTISTLEGAINAYKSMAGIPYVGPALGAAAAAAVTLAGIANINKIRSTNKDSSGSPAAVAAPQIATPEMTAVSPLIDEQADLDRMTTMTEQQTQTQNMRVYVVDQDIRDANYRAQVVEDNATF